LENDILGGTQENFGGEPTGFFDENLNAEVPAQEIDDNPALVNGFDDFGNGDAKETMDPSQAYAAIAAADARLEQLRSEPEKIRIWREENTKLLAEKGWHSSLVISEKNSINLQVLRYILAIIFHLKFRLIF